MGKCREGTFSLFQVVAVVIMCRVTVACAAVPDELDGLAGQVIKASSVLFDEEKKPEKSASLDSVSFVQPVEDKVNVAFQDSVAKPGGSQSPSTLFSIEFIHAFVASLSVIIVSELGDKTFFIAAIMSMRHSRLVIFTGAMLALGLMTVLSAVLGFATTVIPRKYTLYVSSALFVFFGLKLLKEGCEMDPNEGQEELEEVQAELKKKDAELEKDQTSTISQDEETGVIRGGKKRSKFFGLLSPILFQAFTLTFLAEWGDRSQLATILLASRENVIGVTIGGTLGHAFCTGLAVIGGRLIAQRISVRTVTIIGGVVFLIFALTAFFIDD